MRRAGVVLLLTTAAAGCSTAAERGRQLYAAHGCAVCHGPDGHGDGPTARRLALSPRDLSDPRLYVQGAGAAAVARSIRAGTRSGAMPAFRDLSEPEAADIAAWIVSRQKPQ
jgi:mono/diheme cytochrome c family protein